MGISSPGIGSGLDVNSLVSQLISVESQPLTLLKKKEATFQSQVSALGQVKSALSSFQSALGSLSKVSTFQAVKATAADTSVLSASADATAAPGSYAIQVSQLAQAQKLVTAGQASTTAPIGTGTLTFDFGTISDVTDASSGVTSKAFASNGNGTKTVTIDSTHVSLSGIRDAINAASIGVTASIVNDGSATPNRLVLTNTATGAANGMKITVSNPDTGSLADLMSQDPATGGKQAMQQTIAAQDAKFTIDGLSISKPSNHVTDLIQGVSLDLSKTNTGTPTTLTIARDTASVSAAVSKFVDAFNAVNKTLTASSSYDASSKTAAPLNGDSTVRSIQSRLRSMLSTSVQGSGAYSRLADIGVSFQKDGTLAVDSTKLNKALASNFNDVASLFATTGNATDSALNYSGATDAAKPGTYPVQVSHMATQASLAGSYPLAPTTSIAPGNDSLSVNLNGVSASVKLKADDYTADALAREVQSQINGNSAFSGSGITVTVNGGKLFFTSNRYGSASSISLSGSAANALLGTSDPVDKIYTGTSGSEVTGTINGVSASGSGQKLTGASGDASEGLSIMITGGTKGDRGTVSYAKGYASQLSELVSNFLDKDGSLTVHTKGINSAISALKKQEDAMSQRLTTREAALRKQYTALDTQLSSMSSMSSYLTQQLAAIKANSSGG